MSNPQNQSLTDIKQNIHKYQTQTSEEIVPSVLFLLK